ncbi:MAG: carboxymuconolactone decarboxylase family protein [Christensenellales bacterium]
MDDRAQKAEKLIEEMTKTRGYMYPEWEFAARNDPDFLRAYNDLYTSALNGGRALSTIERELVACAVLCFRGKVEGIVTHIVRAFKLGASKQQMLEAIETTIVPGGAPTFSTGLTALMQAIKQCEEQGIPVKDI